MKYYPSNRLLVLPLGIAASITANANTLTFTPNAETTLNERDTNNNMGGLDRINVGRTGGSGGNSERRGLLSFDLSLIPAGSTINSASLVMENFSGNNNVGRTDIFSAYRLLQPWVEGTQVGNNGAPEVGSATWISTGTTLWGAPGGLAGTDYVATASASTTLGGYGVYTWSSQGLASDVQSFVDNGDNFGWIFLYDGNDSGNVRRFSVDSAQEPVLTVDFTPVPEPSAGGLFLGLAASLVGISRRRRVS